jgi:hypothetical protein
VSTGGGCARLHATPLACAAASMLHRIGWFRRSRAGERRGLAPLLLWSMEPGR